jgi:hypothetical protein
MLVNCFFNTAEANRVFNELLYIKLKIQLYIGYGCYGWLLGPHISMQMRFSWKHANEIYPL